MPDPLTMTCVKEQGVCSEQHILLEEVKVPLGAGPLKQLVDLRKVRAFAGSCLEDSAPEGLQHLVEGCPRSQVPLADCSA